MEALLDSLLQIAAAVLNALVALAALIAPLLPLVAWVGFWLFAVDWNKLWRPSLWIGIALLSLLAVLVWGTVAPPAGGYHSIAGLSLSNYAGKLVYVTALVCIMFLCGAVQLAGYCDKYLRLDEPAEEPAPHAHGPHGHGH